MNKLVSKRVSQLVARSVAIATLLGVSSASALTFRLQAGSGHPHVAAATLWKTIQDSSEFTLTDGISVGVVNFTDANGKVWITPIPVDATNVSWSIKQHSNPGTGSVKTNICAFDAAGQFVACSAAVSSDTTSASITVPNNGSAFAKTRLIFPTGCHTGCQQPLIHAVSATRS
jgi:hypothetical protein